jgi:hypothetical protein
MGDNGHPIAPLPFDVRIWCMKWSGKAQRRHAPAPERLEERLVPSASSFAYGPTLSIQGGDNGVVPAVGHYQSGSTNLPFVAVTYTGHNGMNGGVNVFLGDGQGHFQNPHDYQLYKDVNRADVMPEGIIVGRFTHSGFDDLAVADNKGGVFILLGKGDGSFENPIQLSVPAGAEPTYLATATIGGVPYLFVSDFSDNEILVYRGDGAGGFTCLHPLTSVSGPDQIVVADFNRDGAADLAVANKNNASVSIFQGDGKGGFTPLPRIPLASSGGRAQPIGLAVADLNGDGAPDLAVADYGPKARAGGSLDLFRNTGDANGPISFQVARRIAVGRRLVNVVAIGLGDSLPGLAVTSSGTNRVIVLHNRGSFAFRGQASFKVGNEPIGMVASKVTNNDPLTNDDLIVADSVSDTVRVLQNQTRHG